MRPTAASVLLVALVPGAGAFEFRFDLTVGTRGSPLALAQAELVAARLSVAAPGTITRIRPFATAADTSRAAAPLKRVDFTSELDEAVWKRELDIAVHSLQIERLQIRICKSDALRWYHREPPDKRRHRSQRAVDNRV